MEDSPAGSSGDHALTTALSEQVQAELGLERTNGGVGLAGDGEDFEPGHRLGPLSRAAEERRAVLSAWGSVEAEVVAVEDCRAPHPGGEVVVIVGDGAEDVEVVVGWVGGDSPRSTA